MCLARSLWNQGLFGSYRFEYWRFLAMSLVVAPKWFAHAVYLAIVGDHMIRFTFDDILPRLEASSAEEARVPLAPVIDVQPDDAQHDDRLIVLPRSDARPEVVRPEVVQPEVVQPEIIAPIQAKVGS